SVPRVLPDDHPLRPQPPPRPDLSATERVLQALGWVVRRPFEFLGTGTEGTAVWYEERQGGFAQGLSAVAGGPREPTYVSFMGGSIGTRSGFVGGGVRVHDPFPESRGLHYGVTAAATHRTYQEYTVYAGWNNPAEHPYLLVTGFYDVDTMDEFFGLGPDSDEDDESSFSWERWGGRAIAGLPEMKTGIKGNVHAGWQKSFVFEGDAIDQPDAVEVFPDIRLPQHEIGSAGAAVGLDLRDAPGHPTRGVFLMGAADVYRSTDDFDFEWLHWKAEAQAHLPLGSEWHILSFRATAEEADPSESDGVIPFEYLPTLGGSESLRGFDSWRWRDRAAVSGTVEFRYRIWQEHSPDPSTAGLFETALFYDVGQVAPSLDDIDTGDLERSYGVLLRMFVLDRHVASTGVGLGGDAPRFIFSTSGLW
ncbi:MAG: BamA/TamA family outer membrane protein, partial [Gemmatimonadetes bacterium]|nr:BamA/TamA family outer membrane protein [Gemmatimonadota bacterium]